MSHTKNTAKIILRHQALNAEGKKGLLLELFVGSKRKRIALNIFVKPEHFFTEGQYVKIAANPIQTKEINALITVRLKECNDIIFNAAYKGAAISMDEFLRQLGRKGSRDSFTAFMNDEIKRAHDLVSVDAVNNYYLSLKYLHETANKFDITFSEVNIDFVENFEKYLKSRNLDTNTRYKHHKNFKKFIGSAIVQEMNIKNPYVHFKVKKAKTSRDWLEPSEVDCLFNLYNQRTLPIESQRVLRYFLFSCVNGGLRISDLNLLTTANKIGNNLSFRSAKTRDSKMNLLVPYSQVGLALWSDNISRSPKSVFGCLTDQKSNEAITTIARRAGIEKHVTMHVARHTFATNYIIFGGRIEMLQDILGHSKIETTLIYLHIAQAYKEKNEQMSNFDKYFKIESRKIIPLSYKIG